MNKSWLICGAILAALVLAAPAARAEVIVTLSLQVNEDTNRWYAYASISDPLNETLGLHGIYFDIYGTDGLTVTSRLRRLPRVVGAAIEEEPFTDFEDIGFSANYNSGAAIPGGYSQHGAMQSSLYYVENGISNILFGVGETAGTVPSEVEGTRTNIPWAVPVLIGEGVYSGTEGTLHLSSSAAWTTVLPAEMPAPGSGFAVPLIPTVVSATLELGGGGPEYNVLAGQPYAVFSPAPIPSNAPGGLGTTGQLIGPHTASADTNVSMDWRVALGEEADLLVSDVVDLNGIIAGDLFALQMSYDPAVLLDRGVDEESAAAKGAIYVARNIGTPGAPVWVNAGDTSDPGKFVLGPYAGQGLGFWGVDTLANVAWVVTNQSSEFAVVPEPGTLMLLLLGGLGLALCRRRSK